MKISFIVTAAAIVLLSSLITAQYEDTGKRGICFQKKYAPTPAFPLSPKAEMNSPLFVIEDNKEWTDLYGKTWELAFNHYKRPPKGSPFVSEYIDEAFSPSIFKWDAIFMIMFADRKYTWICSRWSK